MQSRQWSLTVKHDPLTHSISDPYDPLHMTHDDPRVDATENYTNYIIIQ